MILGCLVDGRVFGRFHNNYGIKTMFICLFSCFSLEIDKEETSPLNNLALTRLFNRAVSLVTEVEQLVLGHLCKDATLIQCLHTEYAMFTQFLCILYDAYITYPLCIYIRAWHRITAASAEEQFQMGTF